MGTKNKKRRATVAQIREAVANFLAEEGCSCCRGRDYDERKAKLAELLDVQAFTDGSGHDFGFYQTKV